MKLSDTWKPALLIATLVSAVPAAAHHSFAMFNKAVEKRVTGVVETFAWTNPHVMIDLVAPVDRGGTERYRIECASVNILMHQGWQAYAIKHGDKITVVFNPLKSGQAGGLLVKVIRADGSELNGQ